jgi:zinc transport system substrate-binding protein
MRAVCRLFSFKSLILICGLLGASHAAPDTSKIPTVVVTIKPLHSLIASIMDGVGNPTLLMNGAASPHSATLTPKNLKTLKSASVVFWVGPNMESFLKKRLLNKPNTYSMMDCPHLLKLPTRSMGCSSEHNHRDEHHHGDEHHHHSHDHHDKHNHSEKNAPLMDNHVWLSPHNAIVMVEWITTILCEKDSDHAVIYKRNSKHLIDRLMDLEISIQSKINHPINYVIHHDGLAYFDHDFKTQAKGYLVENPDFPMKPKNFKTIIHQLEKYQCFVSEPSISHTLLKKIQSIPHTTVVTVDYIGINLKEGPDAYFDMMNKLTHSLSLCAP